TTSVIAAVKRRKATSANPRKRRRTCRRIPVHAPGSGGQLSPAGHHGGGPEPHGRLPLIHGGPPRRPQSSGLSRIFVREPVADTVDREDEPRAAGVRFDLLPDVLDVRVDRAFV